ncbi:MAG TPA: ABC-F type ribosomal protection protein [Desulfitobacteriaceae bacterium]|nr:ABC-F type ribosomal protection protein [Desulfitobacteriaceae bacterium]
MSQINVTNLTFAYDGSYYNIFENVSFQVDTAWKLGFTGRNGRGKTTFLNLLLGKYSYSGQISASVDFAYFPFAVPNIEQDTGTVIDGILPGCQSWRLLRELNLLQVSAEVLYRPFRTLSGGEQTKVLLAALFLRENSFLLIDEPTNHLDLDGRKVVSDYLDSKKGFILVSHDRAFLDNCVDHILAINKSDIEIQKGNFSSWWHNKQLQDNFELAENAKLKQEIRHLQAAAKRTANWSDKVEKTKFGARNSGVKPDKGYIGHKAAKMMKRSKNIENRQQTAIEEKSGLLRNIETSAGLKIRPLKHYQSNLAEFREISIFYDGRAVCSGISFSIAQGDRVALCGQNGSGKSSILKLIRGEPLCYQGTLSKASGLKISYVSQDTSDIQGNLSAYAKENKIDESLFKAILRKLDFPRVQFEKNLADFSSGQKKKVLLARSLCEQAHLYIWDEPLNYIDIISRLQIEDLLFAYKPTLLFVEHDSAFCQGISTKSVKL